MDRQPKNFVIHTAFGRRVLAEMDLPLDMMLPRHSYVTIEGQEQGTVVLRVRGSLDWIFAFDLDGIYQRLDELQPTNIQLQIQSNGGAIDDTLGLYHYLRLKSRQGVKVESIVLGNVYSAGVLLMLAGDRRTAFSGAMFMMHRPQGLMFSYGDQARIEGEYQSFKGGLATAERAFWNVHAERIRGLSYESIVSQVENQEWWFGAQEAYEIGVLTEPPISGTGMDASAQHVSVPAAQAVGRMNDMLSQRSGKENS